MNQRRTTAWYAPALLLVILGVFFFVTGSQMRSRTSSSGPNSTLIEEGTDGVRTESQLMAVLVGTSSCRACRSERFRSAFAEFRDRILREDRTVHFVAVFLDDDVDDGLSLIRKLGRFDELIVGGNWRNNHGAYKYLWSDFPGPRAVPQVVLVRRRLRSSSEAFESEEQEVLRRLVGVDAIAQWARVDSP